MKTCSTIDESCNECISGERRCITESSTTTTESSTTERPTGTQFVKYPIFSKLRRVGFGKKKLWATIGNGSIVKKIILIRG